MDIKKLTANAWLPNLSAQQAWLFVGVFAVFVAAIISLNN
ncbi:hypothetical protein M5D96_002637 [Drosophila gunungcola]|uniref:Uncharacterized protein n=1 Tax=Drosophila gunungcola TaxID=103775 RepID=A0A9Q0BWL2_9MUSC|nr:hypothetical protein M5D96_002637 [Drosophila gunungcola]